MSFLIYGANGYTGKLIVETAVKQGLKPTLSGRNKEKISALADSFDLSYTVFSLENIDVICEKIAGFKAVLNCAGPFRETARPMIDACIRSKIHYIDITGEIAILEWAQSKDKEAKTNGCMVMCGAGFDLVPTDCVAKKLSECLPDATDLEIAFSLEGGSISHGTMTTMVGNLGQPGAFRKNGKLISEPLGKTGKDIEFENSYKFCMSVPWGDLSAAYFSTGIPNIRTYVVTKKFTYCVLKFQGFFNWFLRSNFFRKRLQTYVDRKIHGPTTLQNQNGCSQITGSVINAAGGQFHLTIQCAESYYFTALAAVHITDKILNGLFKTGYQTPASAYGSGLVYEIECTKTISSNI